MADIRLPKKFDAIYYDKKYFADKDGKSFRRADGSIDKWGYRNPEGEWLGCDPIVKAWKKLFALHKCNTDTGLCKALDVGCGRGTFVAYLRSVGIEGWGFDFSEWAINNPYPKCNKEWLRKHDALEIWPYGDAAFDLVIVLDFMEHIYEYDLDFIINEMYRVAKKWIFLQIAIGNENICYKLKKDQVVPVQLEANVVAGHVTVQPESFWYKKLNRKGWRTRKDAVEKFCKMAPTNVIQNWLVSSIIIIEKV